MSEETMRQPKVSVHIYKAAEPVAIAKAEEPTQLSGDALASASEWLEPHYDQRGLKVMVDQSSILPQCIHAYANNIAGFGIGVRYTEDYKGEEPEEWKKEFMALKEIISAMNLDMDTKKVFEDAIVDEETYGISFIEAIRDGADLICQLEFIKDTPSVRKTRPLDPFVLVEYTKGGEKLVRRKKFCKYKQTIGSTTVYFKELGDPRIMDKRTGDYLGEGEVLEDEYRANELIELRIGTEPYGRVRWIGQVLGVDGSRKAETLNNRYFSVGRHTPMMIMVNGGTLTEKSHTMLQSYMDGIQGEKAQHQILLLETENLQDNPAMDGDPVTIEIKDMASMLQKDELFQDYLDNNRQKVQSAFLLPDLYVGYTKDFNRATAQTAQEVTEKQVFQPARRSLAWLINNRILKDYDLKFCEVYFQEPDITNPEDLYKILTVCNNAGGLTPNKAKEIAFKVMGEVSDDYEEDWGNVPLQYARSTAAPSGSSLSELTQLFTAQIQKATAANDDQIVPVLKEVRSLLRQMEREADV